jgi:hypothetical protein
MQDQNVTPKPTTLTLAVTVTLAGEAGRATLPSDSSDHTGVRCRPTSTIAMTNLLRAELGTVHVFRDGTEVESPAIGALSAPP